MPTLLQRHMAEVCDTLSPIETLDQGSLGRACSDILLSSLGFEPRCLSIPEALAEAGHATDIAVILEYETNQTDNERNWPALSGFLSKIAKRTSRISEGSTDYIDTLQKLLIQISTEKGRPPKVILDISVMANRVIMPIMKVLLEQDIDLTILYAEAETYFPTQEEYIANRAAWCAEDEMALERGVGDVQFSREYPGLHLDPLPDCILLFPNFRAERSRAIISLVDPALPASPGDRVVWLLSVPHWPTDHWRVDAMKEMSAIPDDAPSYNVGTFDYRETLSMVDKLATERVTQCNITLAPLSSKMQALGAAIACYCHPEIRVAMSKPREYNALHFSDGCKARWQVSLGPTATLRQRLLSVGELRVGES